MTRPPPASPPPRANFEYLRKQAKRLLLRYQRGDPHAIARVYQFVPRLQPADRSDCKHPAVTLADAQFTIARENGFENWAALKKALSPPSQDHPTNQYTEKVEDMKPSLKLTKLNQIWLDCTDLEITSAFYSDTLGLTKTGEVPGMMLLFDVSGIQLVLGKTDNPRPNSYLYFEVEGHEGAIHEAYEQLKAQDVKVGDPPHCIAQNWNGFDVWLAFFEDPDGNMLALKSDLPSGS